MPKEDNDFTPAKPGNNHYDVGTPTGPKPKSGANEPMYEEIPPSRRLKNKIIVEEETLIAEKYLERLIKKWESVA